MHLAERFLGLSVGGGLVLAVGPLGLCKPYVCLLQPPEDVCVRSDGPALWVRSPTLTRLCHGPGNSPFLFPGESREASQWWQIGGVHTPLGVAAFPRLHPASLTSHTCACERADSALRWGAAVAGERG